MSETRNMAPVLVYYQYYGPDDQRGGRRRYFCGDCRRDIGGVYGGGCYGHPKTPDDLEAKNETSFGLGLFEQGNEPLEYYAFCPWCGAQFEDEWWKDQVIQNERAIDHYRNPGTHKGDQHEFRGDGPDCMAGHWLSVSGGDKLCWCDPEVEPGIMGCTIRHRALTYEEYEAAEAKKEQRRRAAKRRKQQVVPAEEEPGVVWLAEYLDYEQSHISDVGASPAAVIAAIKEGYGEPYVIDWEPPERDDDGDWTLAGHFECVPGYSTEHTATWSIRKQQVSE